MAPTMKAAVVSEIGDADVIQFVANYPSPKLQPGHVLVNNTFAGLNFIDTYFRNGLYQNPKTGLNWVDSHSQSKLRESSFEPFVCGQEGGGTIVSLSEEAKASGFCLGDRVVYMSYGSYAEYTLVPIQKLVSVPKNVRMDIAVACMLQGLTAHYLVTSAHANLIGKGEWCLIYSVTSGTGQWTAQMAKIQGFKVIGTTSRSKVSVAQTLGCDELIVLDTAPGKSYADYQSVDIFERVMNITQGAGVKCVLDGVGLSTYEISLRCLARRGIFVSFGNASGAVPAFPLLKLSHKSAFLSRPKLNDYTDDPAELRERANQIFQWVQEGKLCVSIDTVFSLQDAARGHKYLESGQSRGKILHRICNEESQEQPEEK